MLACSDTAFSLLTVGQLTGAIIHDSVHCTYYLFDSHSKDDFDNPSSNGASALTSFKTQEEECVFFIYTGHMSIDYLKSLKVLIKDDLQSQPSFELRHEISNNVVCATSKASDQPAHTRSLIRAFASRLSIL